MSWSSTVPAVIAELVTLWTTELADMLVLDGPTVSGQSANEVLAIGFTSEDNPIAVEVVMDPEGLSLKPGRERYSIQCAASVLDGGGSIGAARTRAYAVLGEAAESLSGNHKLGGVMRARIGSHSLNQSQTTKGAVATVVFEVVVDAYTVR